MAKKRKISTKYLDDLFRDVSYQKLGKRCEYCGKGCDQVQIHPHHIYSRKNFGLRWDINNVCILCALHHTLSTDFSAHQTPLDFITWLQVRRTAVVLEGLKNKAHQITRAYEIDREAIKESLKRELTKGIIK